MGIFEKTKGKIAKVVLVLSAVVCCALSFGSVAKADHYYDGGDSNFSTYGAKDNGVPSIGAIQETRDYKVDVIVRRSPSLRTGETVIDTNYVKNYGSSKAGWMYQDANDMGVDYDASSSICNSLPPAWSTAGVKPHLDNNGVACYTCSNCGYPAAYIVDFTQYGYYDKDGKVNYTGYSGYLYCPKCSPIDGTGQRYITAWKTTIGEVVGSYPYNVPANKHWQGVYAYSNLRNWYGKYVITTDPGYLGEECDITHGAYLEKIAKYNYEDSNENDTVQGTFQKCTSYIDGSKNGYYVRYKPGAKAKASSGNKEFVELPTIFSSKIGYDFDYAIKISKPLSNNAVPTLGYHTYKKYNEKINFSYWWNASHGTCIHQHYLDDIFLPLSYNGKNIGKGGYGESNKWECCEEDYEKGYIGICADCGERVTGILYASPQTVSSLRSVENGVEYYYFCPRQIDNMVLDGQTFYYLHSQVENQWQFYHACYATSVNQYYIHFDTNSPSDGIMFGKPYTVGGYFYKVYNDTSNVDYVQEGTTIGYQKTPIPVKSTNTISNPSWTCHGYEFDYWEMQLSDGRWVKVDENTWKWVAETYGEADGAFDEDGHTFNLRAHWKKITRQVKIVAGTSTSDKVLKTYDVPYLKKQAIEYIPSNKTATVTYNYNDGTGSQASANASVKFTSYTSYASNKGVFDSTTKTYYNNDNSTNVDYIFSNYQVGSVVLPTPTKANNVFLGWFTSATGGTRVGGAGESYTPPAAGTTLYAHWSADTMTISAKVTDHTNGTSNVSWEYSNAGVNGTAYYRIYRSYPNDTKKWTDANNTGTDVANQTVNKEYTKAEIYTIPYDGIYEMVLYGAKGSDVTSSGITKKGGLGGVETLRVYLKKGDKLGIYPASGSKSTYSASYNGGAGYVGANIQSVHTSYGGTRHDDGVYVGYGNNKAGYGGAATVVTLNNNILAIAGGGGGAYYHDFAEVYYNDGGNGGVNESSTISTTAGGAKTEDSKASTSTLVYSIMNAGGGAGATGGSTSTFERYRHVHIASCTHTHTAGGGTLVGGTALADGATYSASGGCYTKAVGGGEVEKTCTVTKGILTIHCRVTNVDHGTSTPKDGCGKSDAGYYNDYGEIHSDCGEQPNRLYGHWHCNVCGYDKDTRPSNWDSELDGKESTHTYKVTGVTVYALSCGKSSGIQCGNDENWKNDVVNAASSGGSNYCSSESNVFYHKNSSTHDSTTGKVTVKGLVVGISTSKSYTDYNTDDVKAPNKPTNLKGTYVTKLVSASSTYSTYQIYINGIGWDEAKDNGTKYSFKGETWDSTCTTSPRVSTKNNAEVTVTSGIKGYYYKVSTNAEEAQDGPGWTFTSEIYGVEIDTRETFNTNAKYSNTFYLHVYSIDNAGKKSGNAVLPIPFLYKPDIVSHTPTSGNVSASVNLSKSDNTYYTGSNYYIKADGVSKLCVVTEANVNESNKYTRITLLSLGNNDSKGFNVNTPLLSHDKAHTIASGSIAKMSLNGKVTIDTISDTTTKTTEYFTTVNEETISVTSYVTTSCLGKDSEGCAEHEDVEVSGSGFTVVGDKTAPTFKIEGEDFKGESVGNSYEYGWKVSNTVSFSVEDNGSGIKSIKVVDNLSKSVVEKNYNTRTTSSGTLTFDAILNKECTYTATVEDNVGNVTIVKITTKVDNGKSFITDVTNGVTEDDVYNQTTPVTPNTKGGWPTTKVNTLWEYNWVPSNFTVSYTASDDVSGIKTFGMYEADASWNKGNKVATGTQTEGTTYALDYKVTTEGTTRYILEAIDNTGNTTLVYIIVRIDKKSPSWVSVSNDIKDNILDGMTIAEANAVVDGTAGLEKTSYTWTITFKDTKDNATTNDTSGIASSTLYIYDKANPAISKSYNMLDANSKAKSYGDKTLQASNSKFASGLKDANGDHTLRYSNVTFEKRVNTFVDFPSSAELGWRIVCVDNVGNTFSYEDETIIKNYAVKAVVRTTKDNGYNILSENSKTSLPYFKTGEVGFVEVWTIGYVEKLELDFGNTSDAVPAEAVKEITNGVMPSKYKLGYRATDETKRFVTEVKRYKVSSSVADNDGFPYATHYVYTNDKVNNSIGTNTESDGWTSYGTMLRIPTNYLLKERGETDKFGNALYEWETHDVAVYAYKGGSESKSVAYYVIWDESGDDLHYRIIHQTLGF